MSGIALKSIKRRFSSLNHQNFEFVCLVPRSSTHTGLICGKTLEPNISSLGPFNVTLTSQSHFFVEIMKFFGPKMALAYQLNAISQGQKSLDFQGPTPSHLPSYCIFMRQKH